MNKFDYFASDNKWSNRKEVRRHGRYVVLDATEHSNLFEAPMYFYSNGKYIEAETECYLTAMSDGYAVVLCYYAIGGKLRRGLMNAESLLPSERAFLLGL